MLAFSRSFKALAIVPVVSVLSACGGSSGGGGSDETSTAPDPVPQTITVPGTAGDGGTISPTSQTVAEGDQTSFTLTPDTGFRIETVSGCGGTLDGTTYTTGVITESCTVEASFLPKTYGVSATAGNGGTITPTSVTVDPGKTATFTVTPNAGFSFHTVSGCGGTLEGMEYTTAPIFAECTVNAEFATIAELLSGEYVRGLMRSPKNIVFTDSTSLIFDVEGFDADITKDAFIGRTCLLQGVLDGSAFPLSGSGTFECSDFTDGTWTSEKIAKTNAYASLSEIEMTSGSDVYTIKVAGVRGSPPPNYDSDLDFSLPDAALERFPGRYGGLRQTRDVCAPFALDTSSIDLTITIDDNNNIVFEKESPGDGICEFQGEIDSFEDGVIAASGDYRCANFDEGTWTTERLVMTGDDSMFAELLVDVPARGCSYTLRYLGFMMFAFDID